MQKYNFKPLLTVVCVSLLLIAVGSSLAVEITVNNYSFETPDLSPDRAQTGIPSWNINGPAAGIAHNGWNGGQIDLANSDGEQIAWLNAYAHPTNELSNSAIWQSVNQFYEIGQSYQLTVGVARAAWNPTSDDAQLQIRLWYATSTATTIASVTVTASELNWSNGGDLIDYTATLPKVLATDAWAGKQIGIWIIATHNSNSKGDWVVDNVRLTIPDIALNPHPVDREALVDVAAPLSWDSPTVFTPVGYNVYIGTDPNVNDASELNWTGTEIEPAVDLEYSLAHATTYYWRVDALEPNNPTPIVHTGNTWSFTTAPPVPVITVDPVSQTVASGTVIDLSVSALNADTYTWYQSEDAIADAGDFNVGTGRILQVAVDDISKEGWYYCVASNAVDSDTSAMARVMTRRLVGYWDFEGDLADKVAGSVPTHNGSAVDPNFAAGVPQIGGQGYQFYGDGRVVTVENSDQYFNFYPQGLTISCWVKNQNPAVWDTICSKEYERELGYSGAKGFYLGRSNGGFGAFAIRPYEAVGGSFSVDGWHQLVAVHDPAAGTIRVYVDGVLSKELAANAANFNKPNLAPLIFGAESTDGSTGASSATIDDLKIYNYALDDTLIAQQYVEVMGGFICVGGNPASDLSGDCQVNLEDLSILADNWLNSNRVE